MLGIEHRIVHRFEDLHATQQGSFLVTGADGQR